MLMESDFMDSPLASLSLHLLCKNPVFDSREVLLQRPGTSEFFTLHQAAGVISSLLQTLTTQTSPA